MDDYEGVAGCLQRNGMLAWSKNDWLALWDEFPYRDEFQSIPRGYVLTVADEIVGSISSVWARYALGDRVLRAVFASRVAVDPAHRGSSIKLFAQQLLERGIDLYLNTSASVATATIMDALKVPRVPQPRKDVLLLWPVNGPRVAGAALRRRGVPAGGLFRWPVGWALGVFSATKMRSGRARYAVHEADSFSDEFDSLWREVREHSSWLVGFRDAPTLRWRYGHRLARGDATLLTARRRGNLAGYVILVRSQHPTWGLVANVIEDLQTEDGDPDLIDSLFVAAWRASRADGFDLMECDGFSHATRAVAERRVTLRHSVGHWQSFYFATDRALRAELADQSLWNLSRYDSD